MLFAVFSDSHGTIFPMVQAIRANSPDGILHLGDGFRDALALKNEFPQTTFRAVRGNCDMGSVFPENEVFYAGPLRVFMTHGHRYGVKHGLEALEAASRRSGADVVLYGHTHKSGHIRRSGLHMINPGTAGSFGGRSFALLEISDGGAVNCRFLPLSGD